MREFVALEKKNDRDGSPKTTLPVVTVKETEQRIDLSYHFSGFFRHDVERTVKGKSINFLALQMEGVGLTLEGGKPSLPSFGRYVQIPAHCSFKLKTTLGKETIQLENVQIFPAQENMMDGPSLEQELEFDAQFYEQDELYPKVPVTATGPVLIDGYNAVLIHVCPFRYNARRRQLTGYASIDITLELEPQTQGSQLSDEGPEGLEAFGNLFLNPRRRATSEANRVPGPLPPFPTGPECLIVYAPKFKAAATQLANWKNRRGMITALLEYKGGTSATDAAALQTEIRNRRKALLSRLRYVTLLGDVDDIPATTHLSPQGNATDYYYSTPADPTSARPLQIPWLSLGRIPVRNVMEAIEVVDQIIRYERNPPADPAYYHRFVCAAYFQSVNHHDTRGYLLTMETIRAFLTSLGYDAERVYCFDTSTVNANPPLTYNNGVLVPADVLASAMTPVSATQRLIEATTEGHLLIAHRDHGSKEGWYMPPFTLTDLDHITGTMFSVFYSLNCLTGCWDQTITDECFAEKILRMPGTAPTLLAATELSSTDLNNAMMLGLFDGMYGGLLPTFPGTTASYPIRHNRIGDILNYSRSYLSVYSANTSAVASHCEIYHVVGDPSLEIWSEEPHALRIQARLMARGLDVCLSSVPTDCVVTVWLNEQLLKRIVPTRTRFAIPIPAIPAQPGIPVPTNHISICAWAPGYRYAETQVPILSHILKEAEVLAMV